MARDLSLGIGGDSKDAQRALSATAAEVDKLKRKADDLGDEFRQAARDAGQLDRELAKLAVESKLLAKEFAASDAKVRGSLKEKIDANRTAANELKKIRADIIGDTERDAKRAAAAAAGAAKDLAKLGDGVQTGPSIRSIGDLERALLAARAAVKSFSVEYAKTGDESVIRKIKEAEAEFSKLSGVAKNIDVVDKRGKKTNLFDSAIGDAAKAGAGAAATFAQLFEGGLISAVKGIPPEAQAALGASLAATAVLAAPAVISVVNGAILAGIGAGGLAAGIALAAKDPGVAGAYKTLGTEIMGDLTDAAAPFKGELIDVAGDFGDAWDKITPNVQGFFEDLAPVVGELGAAGAKAAEILGPALERAAGPAAQVLGAIADEIPELAGAAAQLLDDISEHGDSAAAAIGEILVVLENVITVMDIAVTSIGPFADGFVRAGQALGLIDETKLDRMIAPIDNTAAATEGLASAADEANDAFEALFNQLISADKANLAVATGFRTLGDEIKKNKGSLDENTLAGENNRRTILGLVDDLETQRETAIRNGDGSQAATDKANAAFLRQLQTIRDTAAANGANTTELDKMLNKYKNVAAQPDINKTITLWYVTRTGSVGGKERPEFYAEGGIRHAAVGMILPPSDPGTVLAAEPQTGGELLLPLKGVSQQRAMTLAQVAGNAYGFDVSARNATASALGSGTSAAADWGRAADWNASARAGNFTLTVPRSGSAFATFIAQEIRAGNIQLIDGNGQPIRVL